MIPRFALHKLKNAIERQRAELKLSNRRYAVAERFKEAERKAKEQKSKISGDVCTISVSYKYDLNPGLLRGDAVEDLNYGLHIESTKVWESYYGRDYFSLLDIVQTVAELEYEFIGGECGLDLEEYINLWADYIYGAKRESKDNTWSITIDTSLLSIAKWNHPYDFNLVETEAELLEKIKDEGLQEGLENYKKDQKALKMICLEVVNYISNPDIDDGHNYYTHNIDDGHNWKGHLNWEENSKVLKFADEEKTKLIWMQDIILELL